MFVKNPTVKRSGWPYRFWKWTYQNRFWNKDLPERFSLCAFTQRSIWLGFFLLPLLYAIYFLVAWFIYDVLYRRVVSHITKYAPLAALLIWLPLVALSFWGGMSETAIVLVILTGILLGILVAAVVIMVACYLLWELIKKVFTFNTQVHSYHYVPSSAYRRPLDRYDFNHDTDQGLVHTLFWMQPLIWLGIFALLGGFGGGHYISNQTFDPVLAKKFMLGYGIFFVAYYIGATFFLWRHWKKEVRIERGEIERHPEKPSKPKKVRKHKGWFGRWWLGTVWPGRFGNLFRNIGEFLCLLWDGLKALKHQVCPIMEVVE